MSNIEKTSQDTNNLQTISYNLRLSQIIDMVELSNRVNSTRSKIARAAMKEGLKVLKKLSDSELLEAVKE